MNIYTASMLGVVLWFVSAVILIANGVFWHLKTKGNEKIAIDHVRMDTTLHLIKMMVWGTVIGLLTSIAEGLLSSPTLNAGSVLVLALWMNLAAYTCYMPHSIGMWRTIDAVWPAKKIRGTAGYLLKWAAGITIITAIFAILPQSEAIVQILISISIAAATNILLFFPGFGVQVRRIVILKRVNDCV